jgi:hypothetical protein
MVEASQFANTKMLMRRRGTAGNGLEEALPAN